VVRATDQAHSNRGLQTTTVRRIKHSYADNARYLGEHVRPSTLRGSVGAER
jgi:hypothetical protein